MKTLICPDCGFICCKKEYVFCPKCDRERDVIVFLEEVK